MTERKPWVGGNWKCNGTRASIEDLCKALNKSQFDSSMIDVVICPTSIHIPDVAKYLNKAFIVAAQNISKTGNGPYTGEISVEILKDYGLQWTLIGHSERRQYYGEDNTIVAEKTRAAQQASGIFAAVCIGESLKERVENRTDAVLKAQLEAIVPVISDWTRIVIAYEPVWAIGTGKVASPEQAQGAHETIRSFLREKVGAEVADSVRVVYGGSVTEENCTKLIAEKDIDGFLVGGASLKPSFATIIQSAVPKK